MAQDRNGSQLKIGDTVTISFRILDTPASNFLKLRAELPIDNVINPDPVIGSPIIQCDGAYVTKVE